MSKFSSSQLRAGLIGAVLVLALVALAGFQHPVRVTLQSVFPGTPQVGHTNITGTAGVGVLKVTDPDGYVEFGDGSRQNRAQLVGPPGPPGPQGPQGGQGPMGPGSITYFVQGQMPPYNYISTQIPPLLGFVNGVIIEFGSKVRVDVCRVTDGVSFENQTGSNALLYEILAFDPFTQQVLATSPVLAKINGFQTGNPEYHDASLLLSYTFDNLPTQQTLRCAFALRIREANLGASLVRELGDVKGSFEVTVFQVAPPF